jgi:hypothetical protein
MSRTQGRIGGLFAVGVVSLLVAAGNATADLPSEPDAIVVRIVHPDRQAAQLIKLFEGSPAPHPAAALAAWKRATRDPTQLGKTLEAAIALANPEMVPEWKIFHDAELHMNLAADNGALRWHFIAPGDDGTAASMITAFRLSDLEDAPAIDGNGQEHAVVRVARTASTLVTHIGTRLVLAGSRDELHRAIQRTERTVRALESSEMRTADPRRSELESSRKLRALKSGLAFNVRPSRITTPRAGSLGTRRAVELLHALGCRQIFGTLALEDERIVLDLVTQLEAADQPSRAAAAASVEPGWLELIPSRNLIAVISLAVEATPQFWDWIFALADRLERVDIARRDVASLRTRFNLVATAAGVRPEADLWPRLRGVTAAAIADSRTRGRVSGGILVLHTDHASSAERLASVFVPRLGARAAGNGGKGRVPDAAELHPEAGGAEAARSAYVPPRQLATVSGRAIAVCHLNRDVLIAWGDKEVIEILKRPRKVEDSARAVCAGWALENGHGPARVGALWPTRLAPLVAGAAGAASAARILADDPPLVWWGWSESTHAHDIVFWSDLRRRVHRFLSELPLDPPPYH